VPELLSAEEISEIFSRFRAANPNPRSELASPNPFCFLVSVVLSAQATDVSVNKATAPLYALYDTPQKMLDLGLEGLEGYIKSIGLYHSKARHVIALCAKLLADFDGKVPRTRADLESLPGVGRKTASVVLNVVYNEVTMPVDTHLLRIAPLIGLARVSVGTSGAEGTRAPTPESVERDLLANIPAEFLPNAHHWLILHGRYTCVARKPKCAECLLADICRHSGG
jgi:endonuclease-3